MILNSKVTSFIFLILLFFSFLIIAQPEIRMEEIPSDIPDDVKLQILKLYAEYPKTRIEACYVLREMGERAKPAIPFLLSLFGDGLQINSNWQSLNTYVTPAKAAGLALASYGQPLVEPLLEKLSSEDPVVRFYALDALGQIDTGDIIPVLLDSVKDKQPEIRAKAIKILGERKYHKAVLPIIARLGDKDTRVKREAVVALGNIHDRRAVDPLILMMNSTDWVLRSKCAVALGNLGDKKAISTLIQALGDPVYSVQWRAYKAIVKIGFEAVMPLCVALKNKNVHMRRLAATTLEELRDRRSVPYLIKAINDKDPYVRGNVIAALGRIRDYKAIKPLKQALRDIDGAVRLEAAKALEAHQWRPLNLREYAIYLVAKRNLDEVVKLKKTAVEPLIYVLKDPELSFREKVVEKLMQLTGEDFGGKHLKWNQWFRATKRFLQNPEPYLN